MCLQVSTSHDIAKMLWLSKNCFGIYICIAEYWCEIPGLLTRSWTISAQILEFREHLLFEYLSVATFELIL